MKNEIYIIPGGGIFSRFLQCGITQLADRDFDNVFLTVSPFNENVSDDLYLKRTVELIQHNKSNMAKYGIDDPYGHLLNYVLEQKTDSSYVHCGYLPIGKFYDRTNPIELSNRFNDYKAVLNKIYIKNDIKRRVDDFCKNLNVGSNTLGAHVRLTTMARHTEYKNVTYEDYCAMIDNCLQTGKYDNLYVATDNIESLIKLENRYRNYIRYYPNFCRLAKEVCNTIEEYSWEYDMFFHKRFWQESFIECITLSKCGGLICRDSNLSNMAIVFSNTLKNIYRA